MLKRALALRGVPILLVIFLCVACGACTADARTTALRGGLITLNVARDTTLAVSKAREKQIVDNCNPPSCSKDAGHAQLNTWRELVDHAIVAIDDGYRLIYAAAILDDAQSEEAAITAVQKALTLLQVLKNPIAPQSQPKEILP